MLYIFTITLYIFSTTLWLPQDSRSGKNRQRGGTFKSMNFISNNEKFYFNKLRTLNTQLIRAKSHLQFFEKCLKHEVYPENLNVRDHFQIAFKTPIFTKAYNDLEKNTRNDKINLCISHYKLLTRKISEDIEEQKIRLKHFSTDTRIEMLTNKLKVFSNKLSKSLSKTKETKLKKLLKENHKPPNEPAPAYDKWIPNLNLTTNDKEIISNNQELHDTIIGAAIILLQKQYPLLVIQPPSLYFATGFEYCPFETIQIVHNNAYHWILLSSFNGQVKIFDSLNTTPTNDTLKQIKQLFSTDDTLPQFQ